MTKSEVKPAIAAVKELMTQERDGLREIVRSVMQEMLEAEMDEALGAGKGEGHNRSRLEEEAMAASLDTCGSAMNSAAAESGPKQSFGPAI